MQANCYARNKDKQKQEAFKVYISEAVKNINEILANNFTGSYMKASYTDLLNPQPTETRNAEEIIDDIRNGLERLR